MANKKFPKPFKEQNLSALLNNATAQDWFTRLQLIAMNIFEWKGLDEVFGYGASRMLEMSLFNFGRCAFYKDNEKGYLVLNANPSSTFNVYNLPTKLNLWSIGYNKQVDFNDCVYVQNNLLEYPTAKTITLFAQRLYETERTMDVNRFGLKTPVLLEGDEKSMLTLKNVYMQYSGNMPVIFGRKNFNMTEKINSINTKVENLLSDLEDHKHDILNDCLTFLGINSANTDKKERMITDEVKSNDDFIRYCLDVFLKPRLDACQRLNDKYGLNIELKVNSDILNNANDLFEFGGDEVGQIYDNDKIANGQ